MVNERGGTGGFWLGLVKRTQCPFALTNDCLIRYISRVGRDKTSLLSESSDQQGIVRPGLRHGERSACDDWVRLRVRETHTSTLA